MDETAVKRPEADMLKVVKHPAPTQIYTIFGVKIMFAYSIVHLSLLSFTFMYLNVLTSFKFGVFSTLMTGNLVDATLDITTDPMDTAFKVTLIFASMGLGTFLNAFLLTTLRSRENSMAALLGLLVISCMLLDWVDDFTPSRYPLCLLAATSGAMVHWTKSLGYVCSAMTGNMVLLSERLFLYLAGYEIGGPKVIGDTVIIFGIVLSAMIGGLCSLGMVSVYGNSEYVVFLPVFALVPFHLLLSGCFHHWGWIPKHNNTDAATDAAATATLPGVNTSINASGVSVVAASNGKSSSDGSSPTEELRASSSHCATNAVRMNPLQQELPIEQNDYNEQCDDTKAGRDASTASQSLSHGIFGSQEATASEVSAFEAVQDSVSYKEQQKWLQF